MLNQNFCYSCYRYIYYNFCLFQQEYEDNDEIDCYYKLTDDKLTHNNPIRR